jgi:hypothetical protein
MFCEKMVLNLFPKEAEDKKGMSSRLQIEADQFNMENEEYSEVLFPG